MPKPSNPHGGPRKGAGRPVEPDPRKLFPVRLRAKYADAIRAEAAKQTIKRAARVTPADIIEELVDGELMP